MAFEELFLTLLPLVVLRERWRLKEDFVYRALKRSLKDIGVHCLHLAVKRIFE